MISTRPRHLLLPQMPDTLIILTRPASLLELYKTNFNLQKVSKLTAYWLAWGEFDPGSLQMHDFHANG